MMSKRNLIIWGVLALILLLCVNALAVKVENLPRIKLPEGKDDNQVSNVKAIYVGPGGELYIGSAQNNLVQVFSSNGQYLRSIPSMEDDDIDVPQDIDIGIDGYVYIVDRDRDELSRFTPQGMRQGTIGGEKAFDRPMSVSVARDGKVYVADKDKKEVKIFNENGQNLGIVQGTGFDEPIAVDVDHEGRIFILDKKKKTVQIFDSDAALILELPVKFGGQEIKEPVDLCVNQHGELFVLDEDRKLVYFTADFESREWSPPFGGGMFDKPISIDVAGRDEVYVLDNGNETVWKFKLSELPPLVKEKTVKETIINKAVVSNNIDSVANIMINDVKPEEGQVILTVFENNRNIARGLIAENFPVVEVRGQELKASKAAQLFDTDKIDFIFLIGTQGLNSKEIDDIRTKITTEFFSKLDENRHRVAVFSFAQEPKLALPFENSFSKQKSALGNLEFNAEKAPLYDAIFAAINYHDTIPEKNYPIFIMVTNSQGKSSRNTFRTLEEYKNSHDLPQINVLAYDNKKSSDMLEDMKKIADLSGGFFYSVDQRDMIYFLFRRAIALIQGQYLVTVEGLPEEGEIKVSADIDLDGNLITSGREYSAPSGEKVEIKGEGFFEKYGLILLIVLIVLLILIIIIIAVKKARSGAKAPLGEAVLEVKSGDAPQNVYQLMKGANIIGTAKENDITLTSDGVSRHHATIEYAGGKYELIDNDSTNGTFVNKNRIKRRTLINNDVIGIGPVEFIFKSR